MNSKTKVRAEERSARIGEAIQAVLYSDRGQHAEEDDPAPVWSEALALAGIEAPGRILGWVPVYQCNGQSPKDAARAREATLMAAELASLMAVDSRNEDQYWINVDAVCKRIRAHKKANRKRHFLFW